MRRHALVTLTLALAACGGTPNRSRPGAELPLQANPSALVATEFAFARAAQEKGQWTAFADYAAPGAQIFGSNGAFAAQPWLKAQANPAQAVDWRPYSVWSSCDGTLAVTSGGYREPDGEVGTFYTVWQRQRKGDYKWVFDFGVKSDVYPAEPPAVDAHVADCPAQQRGTTADPAGRELLRSNDGTLSWSYSFDGDPATRHFIVLTASAGEMVPVVQVTATGD